MAQRGLSIEAMSARRLIGLLYSLLVEHVSSAFVSQLEVREHLDKWLEDPSNLPKVARRRAQAAEREKWGTTPQARAAAKAFAALAAPPPIKRPES